MKTSKISRYLLVLLCALSSNAVWGQKTVRLYFERYNNHADGVLPAFSVDGDMPNDATVSADGFVWASSYRETSFRFPNCEDRVFAKKNADKKSTHASLTFTNFKYEVKKIEWNRMNDIFSNTILDIFKTFSIYTTTTPYTGTQISGSEGSWQIFGKRATFGVATFPGTSDNLELMGLSSLVMEEMSEGVFTSNAKEINDRCRFFLKAGSKEQEAARRSGNHFFAFQITYYDPSLSFNENMPSEMAIGNEIEIDKKGSELYSIAHAGAFNFKKTYATSNPRVITIDENGKMKAIATGDAIITMTITDGNVTASATKTVSVRDFDNSLFQYHKKSGNEDNLYVREMDHNDGDYKVLDKTANGFKLLSSDSKKFRAGLLPFSFNVNLPKYTKVTPTWNFNIKLSRNDDGIWDYWYSHAELLYIPETAVLDNVKLNTTDNSGNLSEYSFCKTKGTTSKSYSREINNSNNASNTTNKLQFAALAYTRSTTLTEQQVETSFSYTTSYAYVYHSTVSFAKDSEACPYTMPTAKAINSETQDKHLPRVNDVQGYTFLGWSTQKGGTVVYENGAEFNPYDEVNGGGKGPVTLYPVWEPKSYSVTLNHNYGSNEEEFITVYYNEDMPTITPPTREGYIFRGYYEGQTYDQDNDWTDKYYNADGTSAKKWDKTNNATLYAHWEAKTYTLNFHTCGGRLSDNVGIRPEEGQFETFPTSENNTKVSVNVMYNSPYGDRFWCEEVITIRPGYKFMGWFTKETGGEKVYSVQDVDCSFNAIAGTFWSEEGTNGKWIKDLPDGKLDLYAQYECKFEIVDDGERINFKPGYDIATIDVNAAIEEDNNVYHVAPMIVDITEYPHYIQPGGMVNSKGEKFEDGVEAFNVTLDDARDESKLAPNALVYLSDKSDLYTDAKNVIMMKSEQCLNLVVTDRAPIKIPYAFKADKALYERNKNYSSEDAAVAQAANSKWGTLCLPYPIKNNSNNVRFYKLAEFRNNYMHFTPMADAVIPANTPVLYKRIEGEGSDVKIEEAGVDVPMNTSYSTNSGSSLDSWQFIGTLTTKIFCGKDYAKALPAGAEKMNGTKEIYYFKQDKFTHLKNTGKVTMLPYRAYFTTTESNAKVAAFSLIAIDEEGATDITNLIDNDAEGDGKIYDLNGRRVMQPVSGRLYIVDGKKKVY